MKEYPKVSIIVGCYNVEKWIRQGRLNNIYNQTYSNWELILVDDGSTDNTLGLLHAEAKIDSRIRVIHKENGGLGSARNTGLDVATGKYIWSFDVDDCVEYDCLTYCVTEAENRNVDIVMFGFYAITTNEKTTTKITLKETTINSNKELRDIFLDRILFIPNGNGFFWNKFYRRSFIEKYKLRFEKQRIQQDEVFNLKAYKYLEKCYISPRVFYHYYIYNNGNNRSNFIPDRFDIYKSVRLHFEDLKKFWKLSDKRLDDYLNKRFYMGILICLQYNMFHPDCLWTNLQKRYEINRIINDEFTKDAFVYSKKHINGIEQKLFRMACNFKSIWLLKNTMITFEMLRKIKRRLLVNH